MQPPGWRDNGGAGGGRPDDQQRGSVQASGIRTPGFIIPVGSSAPMIRRRRATPSAASSVSSHARRARGRCRDDGETAAVARGGFHDPPPAVGVGRHSMTAGPGVLNREGEVEIEAASIGVRAVRRGGEEQPSHLAQRGYRVTVDRADGVPGGQDTSTVSATMPRERIQGPRASPCCDGRASARRCLRQPAVSPLAEAIASTAAFSQSTSAARTFAMNHQNEAR